MELIEKGNRRPDEFFGSCRSCGSKFKAHRSELRVETCPREHYEFAHHRCSECGGDVIFYPKKS